MDLGWEELSVVKDGKTVLPGRVGMEMKCVGTGAIYVCMQLSNCNFLLTLLSYVCSSFIDLVHY